MQCPKCGENCENEVKFCSNCGFEFSEKTNTTDIEQSEELDAPAIDSAVVTHSKSKRKNRLILAVVVAVVVVFGLIAVMLLNKPVELVMPDVVGMEKNAAEQKLTDMGFKSVSTSILNFNSSGETYYITKQTPEAGVTIFSNVSIELTGSEKILKDYSNFGFFNMDGMNEWITIKVADFTDKKNAYILVDKTYDVISFSNGYVKRGEYSFDKPYNKATGNYSEKYTKSYQYSVVDNRTISYTSGGGSTISDFRLLVGLPVFIFDVLQLERYIPTMFIDNTRTVEETAYTYEDGTTSEMIKIYIDSKYLYENPLDKFKETNTTAANS